MDVILILSYIGVLLGLGIIIANLMKKIRIPDALALILLGLFLGPTIYRNPLISSNIQLKLIDVAAMGIVPDIVRMTAIILIVFISTFSMPISMFKRFSDVSLRLAFFIPILNTAILGIVAHFLFNLEWIYAFLLSSILCGTSVGVLYTFEKYFSEKKIINTLKMESIFNSPLSVLLPLMFLGIVTNPSIFEPIKHISQFWLLIAAGVGTGLVVGFGMTKILKTILKEYTPLLLFATALITFTLAENVGGSGMLAVAICGLIVGNYSSGIREEALKFEDQISELLRIAVFTLLGAQIYFSITAEQFLLALVFFFVIVILRPLMLILFMRKERKEMSREDFLMLSFIAPKGAVEAAMAPVVASALLIAGMSAMADSIMNIVFCIIVFSILLSTIICEIAYKKSEKEKSIKKIYKNYEKLRLPKS